MSTPDECDRRGYCPATRGEPVFLAGSRVAAQDYDKLDCFSDLDVFAPTEQVLMTTTQLLLCCGYTMDDRFTRVWHRWKRYGFNGWKTNSMRLYSRSDVETNVVFKIADHHATTTLAQVLESFDFGLLAVGYDLEQGVRRDLRPYLFQGMDHPWSTATGSGTAGLVAQRIHQQVQRSASGHAVCQVLAVRL